MKKLILLLMLTCGSFVLYAQPPTPGDDPDTPIPFDGGLSLIIAAGVGYGAKKAYDAKKKKQADTSEK